MSRLSLNNIYRDKDLSPLKTKEVWNELMNAVFPNYAATNCHCSEVGIKIRVELDCVGISVGVGVAGVRMRIWLGWGGCV